MKRCVGQGLGQAQSFRALFGYATPPAPPCELVWVFLWRFHITQTWLMKSLAIGEWINFWPFFPPQSWGMGWDRTFQPSDPGLVFPATSPHPEAWRHYHRMSVSDKEGSSDVGRNGRTWLEFVTQNPSRQCHLFLAWPWCGFSECLMSSRTARSFRLNLSAPSQLPT